MHDMNFFTAARRGQDKNRPFTIFLVILVLLLVLVNGLLFAYRSLTFTEMKRQIKSLQDYIDNPATKQAIAEAAELKKEADLTEKYLLLLESADSKLDQVNLIKSSLLADITKLTPEDVSFRSAQISGNSVSLNCEAKTVTAPMDMYHAFKESPLFAGISLSGISISENGSSFSFSFVIVGTGGDQS